MLCLQHVAQEPPGAVAEAVRGAGLPMEVVRIDRGQAVPGSAEALSALVVMGGPMSVPHIDRTPHLKAEKRLVEAALERAIPVLGICLGSQLLAAALGARVERGPGLEVGWLPVALEPAARGDPLLGALPAELVALHWHGDVFDLPRGATSLARSSLTRCQAFRLGTAWGILFHLEADEAQIEAMAGAFPEDLEEAGLTEDQLRAGTRRHLAGARRLGRGVFERWAGLERGG